MKIKLVINEHTTDSELIHLGNFFSALGLNRGARVFAPPPDEAELEVPEPSCVPLNREEPVVHLEAPKRRRRTKEEIAAAEAAAVAAAEAEAQASNEAALAAIEAKAKEDLRAIEAEAKAEAGKDQPAPTPPAPETTTPAEEPASTEPATAFPSSVPTPAELNTKAAAVAKKIGPEKIRDHIRELGGTLISTLSPDALIAFNDWLDQQ